MAITATFIHKNGYKFNIHYRTRGGFLRALARGKNATLDNAVDDRNVFVIRLSNLEEYKKCKTSR